jgi:hypothetical protein
MRTAYQYKLRPTNQQATEIDRWLSMLVLNIIICWLIDLIGMSRIVVRLMLVLLFVIFQN